MAGGAGLVLALGATVYPLVDAVIVPLVAFGLLLVALCSALRPDDRIAAQRVLRLCLAAFVAHVVIGAIIVNSHQLVIYLGSDAVGYDNAARQIVAHWHDSIVAMPVMGLGKEGFYYALAGLYRVLGVHPVVGVVLNGFFAAALVPLFYDLTRRFFGSAAGWWAAVIVTLQPGFLIWTSQLLREAGVLFFLAVALNCASRIASRASPWPLVILAADLTLLLTFRSDVALVAASGLAAGLIVGHRRVVGA
ncbi:MAG: hypothetical protein M3N98_09745, partial [Actinomycetota bacterium]|nr:hypothetical protein [Actinomycetota bacterium]